jgi:hypothetical protein
MPKTEKGFLVTAFSCEAVSTVFRRRVLPSPVMIVDMRGPTDVADVSFSFSLKCTRVCRCNSRVSHTARAHMHMRVRATGIRTRCAKL